MALVPTTGVMEELVGPVVGPVVEGVTVGLMVAPEGPGVSEGQEAGRVAVAVMQRARTAAGAPGGLGDPEEAQGDWAVRATARAAVGPAGKVLLEVLGRREAQGDWAELRATAPARKEGLAGAVVLAARTAMVELVEAEGAVRMVQEDKVDRGELVAPMERGGKAVMAGLAPPVTRVVKEDAGEQAVPTAPAEKAAMLGRREMARRATREVMVEMLDLVARAVAKAALAARVGPELVQVAADCREAQAGTVDVDVLAGPVARVVKEGMVRARLRINLAGTVVLVVPAAKEGRGVEHRARVGRAERAVLEGSLGAAGPALDCQVSQV